MALVLGAVLSLLWLVAPGMTPRAQAASAITPSQVQVTMTPAEYVAGWSGQVELDFNFCTLGAKAGDYFALTLPSMFSSWPAGFDVTLGGTDVTYKVTINSSVSPAVATFAVTDFGATVTNLCAQTQFGGSLSNTTTVGTYTATYQLNSGPLVAVGPVTVNPVPPGALQPPTGSWKSSWFNNPADQCLVATEGCITYQFVTQAKPGSSVTIDDPAGTNWQWACTWMTNQYPIGTYADFYVATYDGNGGKTLASAATDPTVLALLASFTCTAGQLHASFNTSSLTAMQSLEIYVHASALVPSVSGGVTYANSGSMTLAQPTTLTTQTQSTWVGGISTGDSITITKGDAAGHQADTQATAVSLPAGTTQLALQVRNTGTTSLTNLVVTDQILVGGGTVTSLSCDFSPYGGPATGTQGGAAILPSRKAIDCTATLTGVVDVHEDVATVTATGNAQVTGSNPFWATGVMNLLLEKTLTDAGPFYPGSTVHFTLTPSNDGSAAALTGWSVTDVLPAGLTLQSMAGDGYTCDKSTATCTASAGLAAGAKGNPITVTATVDASFNGSAHNVAFVSPVSGQKETNPLVVPTTATDTSSTSTDNDAQASLTVVPQVLPQTGGSELPRVLPQTGGTELPRVLPRTGGTVEPWVAVLALGLVIAGAAGLALERRLRAHRQGG